MKTNNYIAILLLVLGSSTQALAQYISGVYIPDSTATPTTDTADVAVRLASTITADDLRSYLTVLASDEYEGRETGAPGNDKAAAYITEHVQSIGLQPAGMEGAYTQPVGFTFTKWADTDIFVNEERFKHLWEYVAFPAKNRSKTMIRADEVIYLGYGIDDPQYSDYKKNDVAGKVIMIHKGEPVSADGKSHITGSTEQSVWATDINKKLEVAHQNGVELVLIIEDDIKGMLAENRRKLVGSSVELGILDDADLTTANHAYISTNIVKAIAGKRAKKLIKARKRADKKGKACDVPMKSDFIINMSKDVTTLESQNVAAYIEGSTKPDEVIVVSAHYDHLGKRGEEIYNGADDNGSGTSTIMEVAEAMSLAASEGAAPERSVLFLWVTGEEKGLLGSAYYAGNPLFPLENTVADVNVDMVGRVDDRYADNPHYIYVIGSDRLSTDLHKINEATNQKYTQLTLDYKYNDEEDPNRYYFRSDHYNFAKNGIPSIFFFNGTHADYHRTTDTVEKINFEKMESVGRHIFHLVWELANRADRIEVDGEVK